MIPATEREVSGSDVPATRLFVGGLVAECVRARTVRILRDTSAACRVPLAPFERILVGPGAAALAAAPLIDHGVVHGAMLFWSRDVSAFHREARRTIAMVVPHVVNVLMMAGLVEQGEARSPTDPLAGLPDRRALEQRLAEELDRACRYTRPLFAANDALYRAKSAGRNRVRLADDPIVGAHEERTGHDVDAGIEPPARIG